MTTREALIPTLAIVGLLAIVSIIKSIYAIPLLIETYFPAK